MGLRGDTCEVADGRWRLSGGGWEAACTEENKELDDVVGGHLERGEPEHAETLVGREELPEEVLHEAKERQAAQQPEVVPPATGSRRGVGGP